MHEYSLARALLRQISEIVEQQSARRITRLRVSVGEFSGVDADLLQSAFEQLTSGTSDEGARLELETVPLEGKCECCGQEFPIQRFQFICPVCLQRQVQVIRGEDLMLESVTLEQELSWPIR